MKKGAVRFRFEEKIGHDQPRHFNIAAIINQIPVFAWVQNPSISEQRTIGDGRNHAGQRRERYDTIAELNVGFTTSKAPTRYQCRAHEDWRQEVLLLNATRGSLLEDGEKTEFDRQG